MEWLFPTILLLTYGGFIVRDAYLDKTPRDPVLRKRIYTPQFFWASRRSPRERMRAHVRRPRVR